MPHAWPDLAAPEESRKRICGRTKEEIDFCSLILAKLRLGGGPQSPQRALGGGGDHGERRVLLLGLLNSFLDCFSPYTN